MSVTTTTSRKSYTGDGVSVAFTIPFPFLEADDVDVYLNGVLQATGYSNTGAGTGSGTCTFLVAPAVGVIVLLVSNPDLLQNTVLSPNDPFPAKTVETMADKLTLIAQRLSSLASRALGLADGDSSSASLTLPTPVGSTFIAWNAAGTALINAVAAAGAPVTAFIATLFDDADAATAQQTLGGGVTGRAVFTAANASAVRSAIGYRQPLSAGVASNALTVTLAAGAVVVFNIGGVETPVTLGAPISVVASNGSTLGAANATIARLWVVAIYNGGTPELALINCRNGSSVSPLVPGVLISTTAEGGAGAADSAATFYSTTARASQSFDVAGYVEFTQAAAGVYATAPSLVQSFGPGVRRPGETVQIQRLETGAVNSTTASIPYDDTIPQSSEGANVFTTTLSINVASAANLLVAESDAALACDTAGANVSVALFKGAATDAFSAVEMNSPVANYPFRLHVRQPVLAGTAGATTFTHKAGTSAGTLTFNGQTGARRFGGVNNSYLEVTEVMA